MNIIDRNVCIVDENNDVIPNCLVQSCTECCFEDRPGKPNIKGRLHKAWLKAKYGERSSYCNLCPVTIASYTKSVKSGDGYYIYKKGTNIKITEHELMILETDGNDLANYIEVRDGKGNIISI